MHPMIQLWLQQSALIFLLLGSVAGLLVGGLLLYRPEKFQRISAVLNRWISTRAMDKSLEHSFSFDPWFYRYRTITGSLTLLGSLFVLYYFTVQMERDLAIEGLSRHFHYPPALVGGLLDGLVLSALLGALCAVLVALFLLFRPSLLRGMEQEANQWLSLRRALKPMEIPRDDMDRYVLQHARQFGLFLLLGGLYTLVFLVIWLVR